MTQQRGRRMDGRVEHGDALEKPRFGCFCCRCNDTPQRAADTVVDLRLVVNVQQLPRHLNQVMDEVRPSVSVRHSAGIRVAVAPGVYRDHVEMLGEGLGEQTPGGTAQAIGVMQQRDGAAATEVPTGNGDLTARRGGVCDRPALWPGLRIHTVFMLFSCFLRLGRCIRPYGPSAALPSLHGPCRSAAATRCAGRRARRRPEYW